MRTKRTVLPVAALVVGLSSPLAAGNWNGTVKMGGIILDEEGDLSAVQETFNIYDGFSLSQIRLHGSPDQQNFVTINLHQINQDGRRGDVLLRRPGAFTLKGSFDQSRQVFDPDRVVTSEREDWNVDARWTPLRWLTLSASYDDLSRDGDRLSFPSGTESVLGTGYDYAHRTTRVAAEARRGRRGIAVDYRLSDFENELDATTDRTGRVVSARVYGPCMFTDKVTHMVRGSYGISELSNVEGDDGELDYTFYTVRYTGIVRPWSPLRLTYTFDAQQVDNESTTLQTDRILNRVDATFYHAHGSVTGGYSYETTDDDASLTSYQGWIGAATLRFGMVTAKGAYSGRVKTDTEELTLLRDVESSRVRADLEVRPVDNLSLSGGINVRERDYPDIGVEAEGEAIRTGARYSLDRWGAISGAYTHTSDEYTDLVAGFEAATDLVSGRVDIERIANLRLSTGVTYVDASEDLDIEKSIWSFEGQYTVLDDWRLEVQYNLYNYDDYILVDRYYTADVVRINLAYDFGIR